MKDCVFCMIILRQAPAEIIYEDEETIAFLDRYPQARGHLQLVPKRHIRWIYQLPDIGSFFAVAQTIIRDIIPALGADHVTLATFGREVAHAHLWIVPQYKRQVRIKEGYGKKTELKTVATLLKQALSSKIVSSPK